ncbi:PI16 inhibitor, partial [Thryothorus ludovicianus]|nr:PI16 inhibitor [Thryothorus ludovicianus]
ACTMLSSGLPPVLLVLSVLELSWSLSDEEKKIILDEHNKYRSQVSPPAMTMMKMTWDKDLEVASEDYAKKCIWGQNETQGWKNLFATASTLDVELTIEEWSGERKFYNLATSTCVPRQMCDNYTQVPAGGVEGLLGQELYHPLSGMGVSPFLMPSFSWYFSASRGNVKGKMPYREGPSCTVCPRNTVCVNNLCEVETGTGEPLISFTKDN